MKGNIKLVRLEGLSHSCAWDEKFTPAEAQRVRKFHATIPGYEATPLANLANLAKILGLKSFHVKDESYRFGLNAFKCLGGSWCIANYIASKIGIPESEITFERLTMSDIREKLGGVKFVTATDGNHGRGIAWTAARLGFGSVVFMPKGTAPERLANIQALGSDASITDMNYDDTVKHARAFADSHGWPLVQDTAFAGYEEIPALIMQGYMTMALEAAESLTESPTHIFLQAGVGSMAGALASFFTNYYGHDAPIITIIEPNSADCIFRTAEANDGELHAVTGSLNTIMAGLACGIPCTIAWELLKSHAQNYVSMPDYVAAEGMRVLGNPMGDDMRIISGESGASCAGFVYELMRNDALDYMRKALNIDEDSRVLCFSTEGDTDRENYRRVVWDGLYPGRWVCAE